MPKLRAASKLDVLIGSRVREVRDRRGLSRAQIAKMFGVSVQQIQKYEDGSNRLPLERLLLLMAGFNLPWEYFLADALEEARNSPLVEKAPPAFADTEEGKELLEAYQAISSPERRTHILGFVRQVAQMKDVKY